MPKAYENQRELDKVLRSHRRWCAGRYGGKRANFKDCYFEGVTLHNVDLRKVDTSGWYLFNVTFHRVNFPVEHISFNPDLVVLFPVYVPGYDCV